MMDGGFLNLNNVVCKNQEHTTFIEWLRYRSNGR